MVGLSRIKKIADVRFIENFSDRVREKYAGGFIWQCDVTSHYPDQGLRLPYHLYLDKPDILNQFAFFPENPRLFKYGTREISDDDALDLVERFLEIAGTLHELGDKSEDWPARIRWLQTLVGELWKNRVLYPGMAQVLEVLGFEKAIKFWKDQVLQGKEQDTRDAIFAFLDGMAKSIAGLDLDKKEIKDIVRKWAVLEDEQKPLLRDVFPRLDLEPEQLKRILSPDRANNCILSTLAQIAENPYILAEEFAGNGPDDNITFNKVDHGVFPSPNLGGKSLAELDDWRRLRGLCVDQFRRGQQHVFLPAKTLIHDINHKLSYLPEWKRHQYTEKYLTVDEEELAKALVFRELDKQKYVYWKPVYDDERDIERAIRQLVGRPNIKLQAPVTEAAWRAWLTDSDSVLNKKAPSDYKAAIAGQVEVCQKVFLRPVSVICGAAGTGKTRVIDAIIGGPNKPLQTDRGP